jgi:hypothetical protein
MPTYQGNAVLDTNENLWVLGGTPENTRGLFSIRATRLGEVSPNGFLFTLGCLFEKYKST